MIFIHCSIHNNFISSDLNKTKTQAPSFANKTNSRIGFVKVHTSIFYGGRIVGDSIKLLLPGSIKRLAFHWIWYDDGNLLELMKTVASKNTTSNVDSERWTLVSSLFFYKKKHKNRDKLVISMLHLLWGKTNKFSLSCIGMLHTTTTIKKKL